MAGIQGMGVPSRLAPETPVEPTPQAQDLGMVKMPDVAAASTQRPSLDEIFASDTRPSLDEIFADEAPVVDETPGIGTQLKDLALAGLGFKTFDEASPDANTRLKASFARTEKEKRFVLDQKYGAENVEKDGDNFIIKKGNKKVKFDPDSWEIINDFADIGRDVVEQGATELATGAAVAATPASLGVSAAAIPAARAAGGLAGIGLGDAIQSAYGIPRDQERSAATEYGINAGLNVVGGKVADWAASKLASRAAEKAANKIAAPIDLFEKEISTAREASDLLKKSGLYADELSLIEQNPSNPQAAQIFKKVIDAPQVTELFKLKNDAFDQANKAYFDSISNYTGLKPGVGNRFSEYVAQNRKASGKIIGEFRDAAIRESGDGELPVPALNNKINQIAGDLGFSVTPDNKLRAPSIDDLMDQGYSKEGAERITSLVEKTHEKLFNQEGRVTMKEIDGMWTQWDKLSKNLWDRGESVDKVYRNKVTEITKAIRNEYTDKIGVVLPEGSKASYQKELAKFSKIADAQEQIENLIQNDKVSAYALSRSIFNKGKDGLENIAQTKALLSDRPDLWADLTGQYYNDVVASATNASGKTNWTKVYNKISSLGPEVLNEMMGPDSLKKFNALNTVGERLSYASGAAGLKAPDERNIVKNLALSLDSNFAAGNAVLATLNGLDADKALYTALQKDGIDSFLKTAPKAKKSLLKNVLERYVDAQSNAIKQTAPVLNPAARAGAQNLSNE